MLRDKDNNRLYRRVELKIIFPPGIFPPKKLVYKAEGARKAYGPDSIDDMLMHTADQLDQLYPWWDFKYIPLAPRGRVACYNFKVVGVRAMPAEPVADENTFPPQNIVPNPEQLTTQEPEVKQEINIPARQQGQTAAQENKHV